VRKEEIVPRLRHHPWSIRDAPRPMRHFFYDGAVEMGAQEEEPLR
jgi:hypothetical protein